MCNLRKLLFFVFTFCLFVPLQATVVSESVQLIQRVLPGHSNDFIVQQIPSENGKDVFEIESKNGKIILRGNNGVSVATAFNWYLKEFALVSYDWMAIKPLSFAGKLPFPSHKIRKTSWAEQRFINNTCTFGYTFPYWDWNQWQRFIDWMAMNGINRPLMQAGQEAVWLKVWESFGMSDLEVRTYFSGPAHLPWHRMTNMDKWGGPLPISYIHGQCELQKKILDRSRALGMKPILSAFAGHIPIQLQTIFPSAKITPIKPGWGKMDIEYTTFFLDPTDSLFAEIQKRFLIEQEKLYGTDHLYSADPFNEIPPPSWEAEFLANVGKTIYHTMSAVDKNAIWYQMSWTFYHDSKHWTQPRLAAMINAVPKGKLIFLDYVCEEVEYFRKSDNFHGAPFIWNYLGNFGGNTYLVAPVNKVLSRISKINTIQNCVGVGSTLEGLNINPEIYEMVFEMPWRNSAINIDNLFSDYADRRTGNKDKSVEDAWIMLRKNVLLDSAVAIKCHSVVYQVSPIMDLNKNFWTTNPRFPYKNYQLADALNKMFQANEKSRQSDGYQFDVVNLTRQVLGNYGMVLYDKMLDAYQQKDLAKFRLYSKSFLNLGFEIDSLLATRHEFLLGKWLLDARNWGTDASEKAYYERNAREIITTWHKAGGGLVDYANRQWNGLIRSYYLPRWVEFLNRLDDSLQKNQPYDEKSFKKWCIGFEQKWVNTPSSGFAEIEKGDAVKQAQDLFGKYENELMIQN